jgi:hypothetical protein
MNGSHFSNIDRSHVEHFPYDCRFMGIPVTDEDILRAFGLPGADLLPFMGQIFWKSPKKLGISFYTATVSIYASFNAVTF